MTTTVTADEIRRDLQIRRNATRLSRANVNPGAKRLAAEAAHNAHVRLGKLLGRDTLRGLYALTDGCYDGNGQLVACENAITSAIANAKPSLAFELSDYVAGSLFDLCVRGEEEWESDRVSRTFATLGRVERFAEDYLSTYATTGEDLPDPRTATSRVVRNYQRMTGERVPLLIAI